MQSTPSTSLQNEPMASHAQEHEEVFKSRSARKKGRSSAQLAKGIGTDHVFDETVF